MIPVVERTLRSLVSAYRLRRASPQLNERKLQFLHEVDILQDLTPEEMLWLKDTTVMVTCEPGRTIYGQQDQSEVLFILKRGRVQIYRLTPQGKKLELATVGAGTFFGEMPLIGQHMHKAFADAVDESLICVMSRADVERLIVRKPQVAVRMLEVLSQRLSDSESRVESLAFHSVPTRVAGALLRGEQAGVVKATHQEIADAIGAYRETVTNALDDFRRRGLVDLARGRITIVQREGLERVADPDRRITD